MSTVLAPEVQKVAATHGESSTVLAPEVQKVAATHGESSTYDCVICMETFSEEDCAKPCSGGHYLCKPCFQEWALAQVRKGRRPHREEGQRYDVTCPICRTVLMEEEAFVKSFSGVDSYYDSKGYNVKQSYIDGLLHGFTERWYPNGKVEGQCYYYKGRVAGVIHRWYPSGMRRCEIPYHLGKVHGVVREWSEDGILIAKKGFDHGLPHGRYCEWYPNGTLKRKFYAGYGKTMGLDQSWYENGQLRRSSSYVKGVLHGETTLWNPNGSVASITHYDMGTEVRGVLQQTSDPL